MIVLVRGRSRSNTYLSCTASTQLRWFFVYIIPIYTMPYIESEQIVWTTFYTIDRLLEYKNWPDALALYFRYIKQSRIQETNQSFSLDVFMIKWLKRGRDRFRNAKTLLKKLGLIEVIQSRGINWKIATWYVKTNFMIDEGKVKQYTIEYTIPETSLLKNHRMVSPQTGEQTTNA